MRKRLCSGSVVVRMTSMAVLAAVIFGMFPPVLFAAPESNITFSDAIGHPDEGHICKLAALGVVGGYGNGLFGPEDSVTREQFAKMLVLAAGVKADSQTPGLTFTDSSQISDWAKPYVAVAVGRGLISGVGNNTFAPAANVTKAEALTMIARHLAKSGTLSSVPGANAKTQFVDDADIPDWARPAVNYALGLDIARIADDGTLGPNEPSSRAVCCRFLSRMIGPADLDPSVYAGASFSKSFRDPHKGIGQLTMAWEEEANCVHQTSDGGYIVSGPGWLLKLDPWGTIEWSQRFASPRGYPPTLYIHAVRQTADGGYVVAGSEQRSDEEFSTGNALLMKLDPKGNKEWSKTFKSAANPYPFRHASFRDVLLTDDGGYLCFGRDVSYDNWLTKTDARGNEIWTKVYLKGLLNAICESGDGCYVMAGCVSVPYEKGFSNDCGYFLKVDSRGNEIWSRTVEPDPNVIDRTPGGIDEGEFASVCITSDGGYALVGETATGRTWLVRTDASGNEVWSHDCGPYAKEYGYHYSLGATPDGGVVVASFGNGVGNILLKVGADGKREWYRFTAEPTVISGSTSRSNQKMESILKVGANVLGWGFKPTYLEITDDGGVVVVGASGNRDARFSSSGVWVMKTDSAGRVGPEPMQLVAGERRRTTAVEDWGTSYRDWDEKVAAGQRYRYEIKALDIDDDLVEGYFDLTIKDAAPAVIQDWSMKVGVGRYSGSLTIDPLDILKGFEYEGWWPKMLLLDIGWMRRVVEDCHLDKWKNGAWRLLEKSSNVPGSSTSLDATLKIDGSRSYLGIPGASGSWKWDNYSGEQFASGEFCVNPNVPLPLYLKVVDEDGWREYTLVELTGF